MDSCDTVIFGVLPPQAEVCVLHSCNASHPVITPPPLLKAISGTSIQPLPNPTQEVLSSLSCAPHQLVLTVIAGNTIKRLTELFPSVPEKQFARVVPLPPVAHHKGTTIVYPPQPEACALFERLGRVVAVSREEDLVPLQCITCLMGSVYQLCDTSLVRREGHCLLILLILTHAHYPHFPLHSLLSLARSG